MDASLDASRLFVHVRQHTAQGPATVELPKGSFAIVVEEMTVKPIEIHGPATVELDVNQHIAVCGPDHGYGMPGPTTVDVGAGEQAIVSECAMGFSSDEKAIHAGIAEIYQGYRAQGIGANAALQLIYLGLQRTGQEFGDGKSLLPAPPAIVPENETGT